MAEQIQVLAEAELRIKHADAVNRLSAIDRAMQKNAQSSRTFKNRVERDYNLTKVRGLAVENLQAIEKQLGKNNLASGKAGGAARNLGTQFAYLASDAGYLLQNPRMGLMAIGNNLSQITISMGYARAEAKRLGTTLRAQMKKTLLSSGGFLIAINLIIAVATQLPTILKKWGNEQSSLNDAIEKGRGEVQKQVSELISLKQVLADTNTSLKDRHRILERLSKMGVKTKGPDGKWLDNNESINKLIVKQIELIRLRAEASVIMDKLVAKEREKVEGDWFDRNIGFLANWANAIQVALGMEDKGGVKGHISRKADEVQGEIDKLRERWIGLFKDIQKLSDDGGGIGGFFESELKRLKNANKSIDNELKTIAEKEIQTLDRHHEDYLIKLRERLSQSELTEEEYRRLKEEADKAHDGRKLKLMDDNNKLIIDKLVETTGTRKEIEQHARDRELEELREFLRKKGATIDEALAAEQGLRDKWARIERDARWDQAQDGLRLVGDTLQKSAQLNQKNKGLAKAAVITNAAAASIGIWRDYHGEKNTIPAPFNTIAAGVAQTGLLVATKSSLNQINNQSLSGGSSNVGRPRFNLIGGTGTNQIAETIAGQETGDMKIINKIVASELQTFAEDEAQAEAQATIGA